MKTYKLTKWGAQRLLSYYLDIYDWGTTLYNEEKYTPLLKEVLQKTMKTGQLEIPEKYPEIKEVGITQEKQFVNNMNAVFSGAEPHIANVKLMQIYYIDRLMKLNPTIRNEYLTDILYIAQKKGRKVFDFGPFGKLY